MPTIATKIAASFNGSFMGVLNLTIDNAPTKPSDKVIEDLTINTTTNVVTDIITIEFTN